MTNIVRDFAWVLTQVLDGVKEHELTEQFAIPKDECAKVMNLLAQARAYLAQPEPEGPPLEPRGCPTPGACSCPTSPTVPPELRGDTETP